LPKSIFPSEWVLLTHEHDLSVPYVWSVRDELPELTFFVWSYQSVNYRRHYWSDHRAYPDVFLRSSMIQTIMNLISHRQDENFLLLKTLTLHKEVYDHNRVYDNLSVAYIIYTNINLLFKTIWIINKITKKTCFIISKLYKVLYQLKTYNLKLITSYSWQERTNVVSQLKKLSNKNKQIDSKEVVVLNIPKEKLNSTKPKRSVL